MAKRRPKPGPRPRPNPNQPELDFLGEMIQDAVAVARGNRPGGREHRGHGFRFSFDVRAIIIADLVRPYLGQTHNWGPVQLIVPENLSWTPEISTTQAKLVFAPEMRVSFKKWIRWPAALTLFIERPHEYVFGIQAMGLINNELNFARDWSPP